jgi:hypothetical protein
LTKAALQIAGCQSLIGDETELKVLHQEYANDDKIYQDKVTVSSWRFY